MMHRRHIPKAILLATLSSLLLGAAACAPASTPPLPTPAATLPATNPNADIAIIPLGTPLVGDIPANSDQGYSLGVQRLTELTGADTRQVALDVSVGSSTGATRSLNAADFRLVTADGNEYPPVPLRDDIRPMLEGTTLPAGASVRGFVQFALPAGEDPLWLAFCLSEDCAQRLGARILQ